VHLLLNIMIPMRITDCNCQKVKEIWMRQRDSSNTKQDLLFCQEPCGGGPQQET
jgi:hypothetical protein